MSDMTPAQKAAAPQAGDPEPQAGDGQQSEQEQPKTTLSHEDALAALAKTRQENADARRKLRDIEARLSEAEKAKAADAERQAAEQGKFQELYEAEKARAAQAAERLAQLERDVLRKDAAQAAGIPQLWQRLQGLTAEELAEDALALAAMMQPAQPANGQATRTATQPTPQPQGRRELTAEERRAKATRTI